MTNDSRLFRLGARAVQRLLPHRRPLLFVDFVSGYERTPRPELRAGCHISANAEVFSGHFPDFPIWPGVYTVEGLNQACNLLATVSTLQKHWENKGGDPDEVLQLLRQIDRQHQLTPRLAADPPAAFLDLLRGLGRTIGLSAAIEMRFTAPVFAGTQLDYAVAESHAGEDATRYEVEAFVAGNPVARGRLTLSRPRTVPAE